MSGRFGTRTFRRDDEPDYGTGDIDCVVTFDGVIDYRDDAVTGAVSLGEDVSDGFIDEIDGRAAHYEVHDFEAEED